jgi:hypothetical protein
MFADPVRSRLLALLSEAPADFLQILIQFVAGHSRRNQFSLPGWALFHSGALARHPKNHATPHGTTSEIRMLQLRRIGVGT